MKGRLRRYLGCFGVLAGVLVVLALVNFALSWHYRRAAIALTPEGYPKTYKELVALHNRDDGPANGATDLLAAYEAFRDEDIDYDLLPVMGTPDAWPEPGEPFRPEVLVEMNKIVSMNRESLALLRSGVHAETVRFPIQANINEPFPLDQLSQARNACRLLVLQSLCAAESGDLDISIDSLRSVLLLGDWYARQPSLLTQFVGTAIVGMGAGGGQSIIERGWVTRPEDFNQLSALFEQATLGDTAYAQWGEVLWSEQYYEPSFWLSEDINQILVDETWGSAFIEIGKLLLYTYSFASDLHALQVLDSTASLGGQLEEPLLNGLRTIGQLSEKNSLIFGEIAIHREVTINNLESRIWIEGMYRSSLRSTATAVRIAAFHADNGRLPDANEYVNIIKPGRDPMDGELLRYRATAEGFMVYSVGPNGVDDGGRGNRTEEFVSEFRLPR